VASNSNNQNNRLPSPPRLIWHPFTARNPNFVPPGNPQEPYSRTSIPPVYPQPYAYQVRHSTAPREETILTPLIWQTGAGAVYYEGAKYEDRVVPHSPVTGPIRMSPQKGNEPEADRPTVITVQKEEAVGGTVRVINTDEGEIVTSVIH
jgi:hypothetical protein